MRFDLILKRIYGVQLIQNGMIYFINYYLHLCVKDQRKTQKMLSPIKKDLTFISLSTYYIPKMASIYFSMLSYNLLYCSNVIEA